MTRRSTAVADRDGKFAPSQDPAAPPPGSEAGLIARILGGESELFHDLVRPYEKGLYVAALGILRNPADAEDAVQEAVLKAFSHLDQLRDGDRFKNWLLQIAINEARIRLRKNHGDLFEPLEEGRHEDEAAFMPREFADWREIPSETLERKEIRAAVARALDSLSESYREIVILRDVQHLSVSETAKLLGISPGAVKIRLHRARLQMREHLAPVFKRRWVDRLPFRKGVKPW